MIFQWQQLKKPFFVLAPMDGVTDSVFRNLIASIAKPDVFVTEFTNVEGLFSKGRAKVERRLFFTDSERPLIAQIWGLNPELFYKAAVLLKNRGFDGIDINMGCPQRDVTSRGACAALINNKSLAKEIIQATKEGAHNLPVSVKTRIGYHSIQTEEWIGFLLEQDIDAVTVHGRTVKEMSKVPVHWDEIGKVISLKDEMNKNTIIIGNGDIKNRQEALEKSGQYGVDGIMIGRGIFENPWIFKKDFNPSMVNKKERINVLIKHLDIYDAEKNERLPFQTLKKYFKIYIRDFESANELRTELMETTSLKEVRDIIMYQTENI